jgi:AcrR family transcriptional regulator
MSYIAERRGEEKERRRAEILDAAEALYAQKGWDALTVDQVARSARLSRALVYVYFRDKEELLFAIGERAMRVMRDRFVEAAASQVLGLDKIEAIGRSYMPMNFLTILISARAFRRILSRPSRGRTKMPATSREMR